MDNIENETERLRFAYVRLRSRARGPKLSAILFMNVTYVYSTIAGFELGR